MVEIDDSQPCFCILVFSDVCADGCSEYLVILGHEEKTGVSLIWKFHESI